MGGISRSKQGGLMSDVNDTMKKLSDYAIVIAKEKFGLELDFLRHSIFKLETILGKTRQSILNHEDADKTKSTIKKAAYVWGSYLGEFIRFKFGGTWVVKDSERFISINGTKISPIKFVYEKITHHPEHNVNKYVMEVEEKLSTQIFDEDNSDEQAKNIDQLAGRESKSQKRNVVFTNKKSFIILAGIVGVLLLIFMYLIGSVLYKTFRVPEEFKPGLNTFMLEAEKLNVLTEQGVTNSDFRNQLAEVKSAYSLINNSWPPVLIEEMVLFELAITGWDLTLQMWDYRIENTTYGYLVFLDENSILLKECIEYTNYDPTFAKHKDAQEWVELLMGVASQYYEEAKLGIDTKINSN